MLWLQLINLFDMKKPLSSLFFIIFLFCNLSFGNYLYSENEKNNFDENFVIGTIDFIQLINRIVIEADALHNVSDWRQAFAPNNEIIWKQEVFDWREDENGDIVKGLSNFYGSAFREGLVHLSFDNKTACKIETNIKTNWNVVLEGARCGVIYARINNVEYDTDFDSFENYFKTKDMIIESIELEIPAGFVYEFESTYEKMTNFTVMINNRSVDFLEVIYCNDGLGCKKELIFALDGKMPLSQEEIILK